MKRLIGAIGVLLFIACGIDVAETTGTARSAYIIDHGDSGAVSVNTGSATGNDSFSANRCAAHADDSACFGYVTSVTDAGARGFAAGYASEVTGPQGAAFGQATHAGWNAFACGEDTFATGYRSFACGQAGRATARGATALGGDGRAEADFSTHLGLYGAANLRGQLAVASGSFDSSGEFGDTGHGASQWSTLILRGATPGDHAGETAYLTFGASGDVFVRPGTSDGAYALERTCVATTLGCERTARLHHRRWLVQVVSGSTSLSAGAAEDLGEASWSFSVSATSDGWFSTFSTGEATAAVRVVCTEHFTHAWLP